MAEVAKRYDGRTMVIDDDPGIGRFLDAVLRMEAYEPFVCLDAETAIAFAESNDIELAFVDINLPGMNGLDLAVKLKEERPRCEVVFITGSGAIEDAVRAIKIGAYDYLRKPIARNDLRLCLRRFEERKALKETLRLAEERYSDLVQNIPLLIYVLRPDLEVDFVNEACVSILGYTPEEAMNTPGWFLDRIHSDDRNRIETALRSAFSPGVPAFSFECRMMHKREHPIHTIIKSIRPLRTGPRFAPQLDRLQGIIVDITDRVFLEKAVVQKEKLKTLGAISAEVAHEIRNPLVSIGGFAQRLQRKYPDLEEVRIILSESKRLERILDRIRNYLTPVEISRRSLSVNSVILECIDILRPEIERKNNRCQLDLDPSDPKFCGDRDILAQVFINLTRNALEAMEQDEVLTIRTHVDSRNVHVQFVNPTHTAKLRRPELLFLPFDEGVESIGLPLCYRLTRNMGGVLSAADEHGQVVFTVSLPKENG